MHFRYKKRGTIMFLERNSVPNKELFDFDTDLYDYKAWTPQLSLGYLPDVITQEFRLFSRKERERKKRGRDRSRGGGLRKIGKGLGGKSERSVSLKSQEWY